MGLGCFALQSYAQPVSARSADDTVDASSRSRIVNVLADKMRDLYVYPEVGEKTEKALRKKLNEGGYDSLKYAVGLAKALTRDLQASANDKHLRVDYGATTIAIASPDDAQSAADGATELKKFKAANFGVGTVERLPGNIGYLQINGFGPLKPASRVIAAAMAQLTDTAALIVDLRHNGGGYPETGAFLSSYLFDKRTHLSDDYERTGGRITQYWTQDKVPGRKFGQSKPVYVLMSSTTFSAGEGFGYDLKNLKRAILVGEVTAGGANGGNFRRLSPRFYAFIPESRAVNPITKSNWEGAGVEPDVHVPARNALLVAQKLALQTLSATEKDQRKAQILQVRMRELDAQLRLPTEALSK